MLRVLKHVSDQIILFYFSIPPLIMQLEKLVHCYRITNSLKTASIMSLQIYY